VSERFIWSTTSLREDQVESLEDAIRRALTGKVYTWTCSYEYAGWRPESRSFQRLKPSSLTPNHEAAEAIRTILRDGGSLGDAADELGIGRERCRQIMEAEPVKSWSKNGHFGVTVLDTYGVWGIHKDQAVVVTQDAIEVRFTTPEGKGAWWIIKVEHVLTDVIDRVTELRKLRTDAPDPGDDVDHDALIEENLAELLDTLEWLVMTP